MIWFFHFIVVTILLLITIKIKKEDFFIKSSFLYVVFIFGQRWMTGTDFPNYLRYYLSGFQVQEPIYKGLQNFISTNNLYFGLLIFIVFSISIFNNYRFIIKVDQNVVLLIYLYLLSEIYFAQMSQIRQFAAISFFINAYFYSYGEKRWKTVLNILLGLGFHTSIVFLIPFLLIRFNITRIKALYIIILSAVLPLLDITIILQLPLFSRYSHYIESRYNVSLSPFHLIKFYTLLLIVFIFIWNLKKYKKNPIDQMILNGILMNLVLYSISFQFGLMIRISSYFKIFELVFLTYYIEDLRNYSKFIVKTVSISFFILVYVGLIATDPYNITRYEFRHLRFYDEMSNSQLYDEIEKFHNP